MVADINGTAGRTPANLTDVDGTLYFTAYTTKRRVPGVAEQRDGGGTVMDTSLATGSGNVPSDLTAMGGDLYFTAPGASLWQWQPASPTPTPTPTATATFLKQDATTQGSWIGTYGAQGYDIVSGPSSLPAGDTVTPSGAGDLYLDDHLHRPPRLAGPRLVQPRRRRLVLRRPASPSTSTSADGQTHDLELYFDDWDNKGRGEQVQISDAATGTVLDTETISSFTSGVYLDWKVSGNLVITITRRPGPMPSSTACSSTSRSADAAAFLSSSRTRRRRGAGSAPTARRARTPSTTRPSTGFPIDADLTDGQAHDTELSALDRDK